MNKSPEIMVHERIHIWCYTLCMVNVKIQAELVYCDASCNLTKYTLVIRPTTNAKKLLINTISGMVAARFVTPNYRQIAIVKSVIENLGWTNLETRRTISRLLRMFKI